MSKMHLLNSNISVSCILGGGGGVNNQKQHWVYCLGFNYRDDLLVKLDCIEKLC